MEAVANEDNATLGTRGGTGAERSGASVGASRSEASEWPILPSLDEIDVLFLCSGHGKAKPFVASLPESYKGAIIDLGNDYRLSADAEDFVYGLPEAFRDKIKGARHIANPGCFATSIQLALLPMAKADLLPEIHVTGITGSTGAGQAPSETTHFSWRTDNLSVYKAFTHQHLGEINETLHALAPNYAGQMNFVPVRGDFARGILASVYFDCDLGEEEAVALYKDYYKDLAARAGFWGCTQYWSYKEANLPYFKGNITAVEESNTGYRFSDQNEQDLRGKLIGAVFGEEEYKTKAG